MAVLATMVVLANLAAGAIVLGFWTHPTRWQIDKRSTVLVVAHVVAAAGATFISVVYLISRNVGLASIGVVAVAVTASLGIATLLSSRRHEGSGRIPRVPLGALAVHGAGAAMVVALAVIAASQV